MNTLTQFALGILTKASDLPKTSFRMPLEITSKLDDSPVTIVDQNTEKLIRDALKQEYPGHAISMTSGGRVVSAANPELHQELISELSR